MSSINLFLLVLVASIYSQSLWAGSNQPECAISVKSLHSRLVPGQPLADYITTELPIRNQIPIRLALPGVKESEKWQNLPVFEDFALAESGLLTLEPIERQRPIDLEVQTARDYAKHLYRANRQRFIYMGDYNGRSVPVFDGAVVNSRTGVPEVSVSIKFASVKMKRENLADFLQSMKGRLNYDIEFDRIDNSVEWLRQVTTLDSISRLRKRPFHLEQILEDTSVLMRIFGVHPETSSRVFTQQEIKTVLDVRDHGYSIEFVAQDSVSSKLVELVKSTNKRTGRNLSLTLLWNADQIIEINEHEARVFCQQCP